MPLQNQVFQKLFGTETSLITAYLPNDTANLTASHDTVYSYRRTDETLTGFYIIKSTCKEQKRCISTALIRYPYVCVRLSMADVMFM